MSTTASDLQRNVRQDGLQLVTQKDDQVLPPKADVKVQDPQHEVDLACVLDIHK
jgi:hypothetical protein